MARKRYRVGGTVSSTNKGSKAFNETVFADSPKAAENLAKTRIKKRYPDGYITIGVVTQQD
ncbi:hypothetical protein [Streptomyces sp. NPDC048172]|uniref:hypothetical protein n=1 Tax=Streptomyces sp. NPDC048172 TaxID=3365505 RepID=UPI003710D20E